MGTTLGINLSKLTMTFWQLLHILVVARITARNFDYVLVVIFIRFSGCISGWFLAMPIYRNMPSALICFLPQSAICLNMSIYINLPSGSIYYLLSASTCYLPQPTICYLSQSTIYLNMPSALIYNLPQYTCLPQPTIYLDLPSTTA